MNPAAGKFAEMVFSKTEDGCCVRCKQKPTDFRDMVSEREWKISRLCQQCQDCVFAEGSTCL